MDISAYFLFGIALLSLILGFVALLTQRVYLDAETNQPTEVDVRLLGKLKSNYPALVFVFLDVALAVYGFQKAFPPPLEPWVLQGRFVHPAGKPVDTTGTLALVPVAVRNHIDPHGRFEINVDYKREIR